MRENLHVGADDAPQIFGSALWVDPGFQLDRAEIDDAGAAEREEPGEILGVGQDHAQSHKARSQDILPADRDFAIADLDAPAGIERPEHRAGGAVDQDVSGRSRISVCRFTLSGSKIWLAGSKPI